MSGYRCVNYYDLCRLCTASSGTKIHIFSAEGRRKNLSQKISECLPVVVDERDKLPKILCSQCLQQVESIAEFRNVCVNSQTMLESCLSSTTIQNGGKVYIKDGNVTVASMATNVIKSDPIVTNAATQSSDFLSTIIQAVGIQSNEDTITETKSQVVPQYTVTLDAKTLKTGQIDYKVEEPSTAAQNDRQAKHNSLAEFLKMKPNIKVTPIPKKKEPPPVQTTAQPQFKIAKQDNTVQKKAKYNLVLASPNQQKATLTPAVTSSAGKTISLQDLKILSPNKCFLPITIKDCNSDQQIVAQIDTKNLVLPTTYHLQMKLQPQIATVDGQPIVQLTPTAIPATLSLAPTQTVQNQNFQQDQNASHIISGGIDASTSTNDSEIIFTTNQIQNQVPSSITIQQISQPSNVQSSLPKLQITTIPSSVVTNNTQMHTTKAGGITVQRISQQNVKIKTEPGLQQQQQQQQQHHQQQQQHQQQQTQVQKITVNKIKTEGAKTATTSNQNKADGASTGIECSVCGRAFKKKEHLAQHAKLHAGLRPFKCTEAGCNKAFSRKEHLLRHIVSHTGKKMFSCDLCQKLFSRKDNLNKHKRTHSDQNGGNGHFVCEVCNKTFVVKMYYMQHKAMHEKQNQAGGANKRNVKSEKITDETQQGNNMQQQQQQQQQQQHQQQQQDQQQQEPQVVELQMSSSMETSNATNTISISQANQQTTTAVLKTLGSHDTAVLNLPSSIANLVSINSSQFMTAGELMGHFKMENN